MKKFLIFFCIIFTISINAQSHNWNSPSDVVKKIKKKFTTLKSYSANFHIISQKNKKTNKYTGICYFKKPGKIRYDFKDPAGDTIVSDGKILWIYMHKLGVVGKQDLSIKKNNSSNDPIFQTNTVSGLNRLFRKYHYKFKTTTQPQTEGDGKKYFVLDLEQREKIGGFETMILYIDAESYLITKAIGTDGKGKQTILEYTNMKVDEDIEDGMFNYHNHISGNAKIVNNPLVSDNQ